MARGALNQADEHLNRAHDAFIQGLFAPSSRLTDEENDLYTSLKKQKYVIHKSGGIGTRFLDGDSEKILKKLERKAFGQDQE